MATTTITRLTRDSADYPCNDCLSLGQHHFRTIDAIGNLAILRTPGLALFCSVRCSGNLILKTYDLARSLRDAGIAAIGGFHSPMEKECLDLLLRGTQPIIVCPARSIDGMRLAPAWKAAIAADRLLLLSPFDTRYRRQTADLADQRNHFVAALARAVLVTNASEGGKTEALCSEVISAGKPVYTFDADGNSRLMEMGAIPIVIHELLDEWTAERS